jgi:hypothetical protein
MHSISGLALRQILRIMHSTPKREPALATITLVRISIRADAMTSCWQRLARDDRTVYFYVRTPEPITDWRSEQWMQLSIHEQGEGKNPSQDIHLLVNVKLRNARTTTAMEVSHQKTLLSSVLVPIRV